MVRHVCELLCSLCFTVDRRPWLNMRLLDVRLQSDVSKHGLLVHQACYTCLSFQLHIAYKFHGSSFFVAFSRHPHEDVTTDMSGGNRACRTSPQGCHRVHLHSALTVMQRVTLKLWLKLHLFGLLSTCCQRNKSSERKVSYYRVVS